MVMGAYKVLYSTFVEPSSLVCQDLFSRIVYSNDNKECLTFDVGLKSMYVSFVDLE